MCLYLYAHRHHHRHEDSFFEICKVGRGACCLIPIIIKTSITSSSSKFNLNHFITINSSKGSSQMQIRQETKNSFIESNQNLKTFEVVKIIVFVMFVKKIV